MKHSELTFSFQPVTKEQITNLIRLLNNKKAIQSTDTPTKLIKEYCVVFSEFIHKDINLCIAAGNFVDDFKQAEVRPFYKKDGRTDKLNYRPISILSNVSKIYERSFTINCKITLIKIFFLNTNVVFVKASVYNTHFLLY